MPKTNIPVETLIADLHGPDWQKRCDAARLLGQSRDPRAVEALLPDLDDPDWKVRRNAAQALGALKDPRAVDGLLKALKDRTATVRERAAVGLGRIKDPGTIPALLEALVEEKGHVNEGAYQAIRKFGLKAGPHLAEALKSGPNIHLVELLAQSGFEAQAELFIGLAQDVNPLMRRAALNALGKTNDPKAVDFLMGRLAGGDLESQALAARSLGHLQAAQAIPIMLDLLQTDQLHGPRAGLYQAISAAFQELGGIKGEVEQAFPGKYPAMFNVSGASASLPEFMGMLGEDSVKKLNDMLTTMEARVNKLGEDHDLPPGTAQRFSEQAWKYGVMFADAGDARRERVKVLIELLKSAPPLAQAAAALALPWYMDASALEPLEQAAHSPDETLRRASAWAHAALKTALQFRP